MPTILEDIRDIRLHAFADNVYQVLADTLRAIMRAQGLESKPVTVVCIGTDRSTGDSLGPLVGSMLRAGGFPGRVWGTLESPVHAVNLPDVIACAARDDAAIIAVDACLGKKTEVGYILVGPGPVLPGAGLRKRLPGVGDVHITGVVNIGGFMDYAVLQCTRLHTVIKMATAISLGLLSAFGTDLSSTDAAGGSLATLWVRANA